MNDGNSSKSISKSKRLIKFYLLAAGFVFLANPYIDMLDLLPDFIGYLLIYSGVSVLARLDDRLALASQKLIYLAILSFARFAAFVLTLGSDSSMILMLTFTFGVAEILLISVFLNDFFGGFEYLLQRYGGYEALSGLSNIRFLSLVFYLVKIILCVVPNLVAIAEVEAIVDISASTVLTEIVAFKPYAVILFFTVTLIFGVWWYNETRKYFSAIKKDEGFNIKINEVYAKEAADAESHSAISSIRVSFLLTAAGFVFLLDITVGKIPILPDMAATLLIWWGARALKSRKTAVSRLALPAVLALICQTAYTVCFKLYAYTEISKLSAFPVKNAVILAAVSAAYASACFFFISKAFDFFAEATQNKSDTTLRSKLNKLLIVYALYLILTVAGTALPTAYAALLFPRTALISAFVVITITRYYSAYDEYSESLEH